MVGRLLPTGVESMQTRNYQLVSGSWWRDAHRRYFRSPGRDHSPGNPILYRGTDQIDHVIQYESAWR